MHIYHPSRHYIYYRFSRRTDKIDKILQDMGDLNLPLPQNAAVFDRFVKDLLRVRKSMRIPYAFAPKERPLNQPTIEFLRTWGIHDMWLRARPVEIAEDLLMHGGLRPVLETMLLGPVSPNTIADRLRTRFNMSADVINPLVIRAYAHYFWDPAALNSAQWTSMIFGWMPGGDKSTLLMALRAPRTPSGAQMVLNIADGDVDQLTPQETYDSIRGYAWRAFMQHATTDKPSLARTQAMLHAFTIIKDAGDAADAHRGGDNEIVAALSRFHAKTGSPQTATVYDIPAVRELPVLVDTTLADEEKKEETTP